MWRAVNHIWCGIWRQQLPINRLSKDPSSHIIFIPILFPFNLRTFYKLNFPLFDIYQSCFLVTLLEKHSLQSHRLTLTILSVPTTWHAWEPLKNEDAAPKKKQNLRIFSWVHCTLWCAQAKRKKAKLLINEFHKHSMKMEFCERWKKKNDGKLAEKRRRKSLQLRVVSEIGQDKAGASCCCRYMCIQSSSSSSVGMIWWRDAAAAPPPSPPHPPPAHHQPSLLHRERGKEGGSWQGAKRSNERKRMLGENWQWRGWTRRNRGEDRGKNKTRKPGKDILFYQQILNKTFIFTKRLKRTSPTFIKISLRNTL